MEKNTLRAEFKREYSSLLADDSKKIKGGIQTELQGELYQRYKKLGLSTNDMASILVEVEGKSGAKAHKATSQKINDCIRKYKNSQEPTVNDTAVTETGASSVAIKSNDDNLPNRAGDIVSLTLDELTRRINSYVGQMTQNIIEIGRCLIQVRVQIGRGRWISWVEENTRISRQTANKFIQCAERFENVAPARQLAPTKMMELLALPEPDTVDFFTRCEEEGTPVQNMTKTELRNKIKQWKNPPQAQEVGVPSVSPAVESEVSTDVVTTDGTSSGEPEYVELTFRVAQGDKQVMYQVLSAAIEQSQLSEASRQSVLAEIRNLL